MYQIDKDVREIKDKFFIGLYKLFIMQFKNIKMYKLYNFSSNIIL